MADNSGRSGMLNNPSDLDAPELPTVSTEPFRDDDAIYLGPAAASKVHDLCNALTVVLGSLEQLRRQSLDRRGQEQLDRAEWGAQHAGQLAREFLAANPDEGSKPPSWT